ncbi:MAG: S9 family peptidase, partial [Silvibacterium sp.]
MRTLPAMLLLRSVLIASTASVCGFFTPLCSQAQSFTLPQILGVPFSSNLTAAPKGNSFAWVSDAKGHRDLWVSVDGHSRQLTHDAGDDGIDLGNLTWTPDGESIVYVRGGDFEFPEKPSPNPALLKDGIDQQIWIVPVTGGEPRLLTNGQAPAVSPDGRTLAYLLKDQVWTLDLTQPGAKPAQLFVGRGKEDDLEWAPDSHALAFVSHRGDHSFIGLFTFAGQQVSYLAPGTYRDESPVWSPDSRQVAFRRVPPDVAGERFGAHRTAAPWSLFVADAATGE